MASPRPNRNTQSDIDDEAAASLKVKLPGRAAQPPQCSPSDKRPVPPLAQPLKQSKRDSERQETVTQARAQLMEKLGEFIEKEGLSDEASMSQEISVHMALTLCYAPTMATPHLKRHRQDMGAMRKWCIGPPELYAAITQSGGFDHVTETKKWASCARLMGAPAGYTTLSTLAKKSYRAAKLVQFEQAVRSQKVDLTGINLKALIPAEGDLLVPYPKFGKRKKASVEPKSAAQPNNSRQALARTKGADAAGTRLDVKRRGPQKCPAKLPRSSSQADARAAAGFKGNDRPARATDSQRMPSASPSRSQTDQSTDRAAGGDATAVGPSDTLPAAATASECSRQTQRAPSRPPQAGAAETRQPPCVVATDHYNYAPALACGSLQAEQKRVAAGALKRPEVHDESPARPSKSPRPALQLAQQPSPHPDDSMDWNSLLVPDGISPEKWPGMYGSQQDDRQFSPASALLSADFPRGPQAGIRTSLDALTARIQANDATRGIAAKDAGRLQPLSLCSAGEYAFVQPGGVTAPAAGSPAVRCSSPDVQETRDLSYPTQAVPGTALIAKRPGSGASIPAPTVSARVSQPPFRVARYNDAPSRWEVYIPLHAAQRSSIRVTCRSDGRVRVYCPTDANQDQQAGSTPEVPPLDFIVNLPMEINANSAQAACSLSGLLLITVCDKIA